MGKSLGDLALKLRTMRSFWRPYFNVLMFSNQTVASHRKDVTKNIEWIVRHHCWAVQKEVSFSLDIFAFRNPQCVHSASSGCIYLAEAESTESHFLLCLLQQQTSGVNLKPGTYSDISSTQAKGFVLFFPPLSQAFLMTEGIFPPLLIVFLCCPAIYCFRLYCCCCFMADSLLLYFCRYCKAILGK